MIKANSNWENVLLGRTKTSSDSSPSILSSSVSRSVTPRSPNTRSDWILTLNLTMRKQVCGPTSIMAKRSNYYSESGGIQFCITTPKLVSIETTNSYQLFSKEIWFQLTTTLLSVKCDSTRIVTNLYMYYAHVPSPQNDLKVWRYGGEGGQTHVGITWIYSFFVRFPPYNGPIFGSIYGSSRAKECIFWAYFRRKRSFRRN